MPFAGTCFQVTMLSCDPGSRGEGISPSNVKQYEQTEATYPFSCDAGGGDARHADPSAGHSFSLRGPTARAAAATWRSSGPGSNFTDSRYAHGGQYAARTTLPWSYSNQCL